MNRPVKIAVIGDFNFTFNTHHATNLALDHASRFLEIEINYYWIKLSEASLFKNTNWNEFDGVWIAPGPYKNEFYLKGILDQLIQLNLQVLISGEGFKSLIELLITKNNLNPYNEKLISDNLVGSDQFEKIEVVPHSKAINQLYQNHTNIELSASRFSIYPQLVETLNTEFIDIEAYNSFEEVEIFSLKHKPFFLVTGFVPQVTSTRELPHPLVYTFIKACLVAV
jgi:CTP synthase (UTP-ammonia lyase)